MSLTIPRPHFGHRKTQPVSVPRYELPEFDLPPDDRADALEVLPYDSAIGNVAAWAVLKYGIPELERRFDSPEEAKRHAAALAQRLLEAGRKTSYALEPTLQQENLTPEEYAMWLKKGAVPDVPVNNTPRLQQIAKSPVMGAGQSLERVHMLTDPVPTVEAQVRKQLDEVWKMEAVTGVDALVTLHALRDWAVHEQGKRGADLAAQVLSTVEPDAARIALK